MIIISITSVNISQKKQNYTAHYIFISFPISENFTTMTTFIFFSSNHVRLCGLCVVCGVSVVCGVCLVMWCVCFVFVCGCCVPLNKIYIILKNIIV